MPRRDAFLELREPAHLNHEVVEHPHEASAFSAGQNTQQPLDLIPSARPRKKRNRNWEQAHRAETVTYRSITREYQEWIIELSESLCVPRDEVVRAFLEFGIDQYHCGLLPLIAYPKAQRMTLFPEGKKSTLLPRSQDKGSIRWLNDAFPVAARTARGTKKGKGNQTTPLWEVRVTYRIPVHLKNDIRSIAEEHTLPVGEVVWYFMDQALKAFQDGKLSLQPVPRTVGKTLFKDVC